MHTTEGALRAYLDGELEAPACAAVAAHLRECGACRKQLEWLAGRASATSQHLQALAPRGAELPAPSPVALTRLHTRLAAEAKPEPARGRQPTLGGLSEMFQKMFNRRYRAVWSGLAAVLVVVALFALPPVRAAAGQFLGLFRVRKFAVVTVNPAALQNLDKAGGQIHQLLSDNVTFVKEPGEPVAVANAAEASQKAGIQVRLPASGAPQLKVADGMDAKFKVDLARMQAILDAVGRNDIKLPAALNGANVEVVVPPSVTAEFGTCPAVPTTAPLQKPGVKPAAVSSDCVMLVQMASPTVDAPAGVDISQVGEAMLEVLGLSPDEAQHFAQSIDWSSTVVIPMPTDAGSFRDVTVDGTQGVLIESKPSRGMTHYMLLWQKNGTVYGLSGVGDSARGLELANNLK